MTDFSTDLSALYTAADAWSDASGVLTTAAAAAEAIRVSHANVQWGVFQDSWNASVNAADYMKNRLTEGSTEAAAIGNVLQHVAKVYHEQDENFKTAIVNVTTD
ncbi:hypothetical protein [Nocardia sp. NPDC051832]|uniref:hypothetical protein n=1 Tax=Nocardia sp. NPDC051832 TaxID=3155673 RepID=UPI00342BADCA